MKEYFTWLAKLLTLVFLIFFVVPLLVGSVLIGIQTAAQIEQGDSKSKVAVVEITGLIESSKEVVEQLHKQVEDSSVSGIVLRIDSPGGAVGPSQDIYETVKKLKEKKPIVATMGSVAASGGFYSALGASKILAQPGTLTGSIGVIMQLPNFQQIMGKIGVEMITIKSGALKDVGNTFREMTPEERQFIQGTIDIVHNQFIQAVVQGRNIPEEKVKEFADGRVILGSQAKELGLIDGYGDVYAAAREVFEIQGKPLPPNEYPVLYYPTDKFSEFKKVFNATSSLVRGIFQQSVELRYVLP